MINYISGIVKDTEPQLIVLDKFGFNFLISVPNEAFYCINQETSLNIYFHWNQETGPQLFGFQSKLERDLFSLIISCSGIGPKLGLSILAQISAIDFINSIIIEDKNILNNINGLGSKKIDLLILQLKNKVNKLSLVNIDNKENKVIFSRIKEVTDVLSSLNYSKQEISVTLDFLKSDKDFSFLTFDQLLKKALSNLVKKYV